jgi:hypothetical protein
MDAEIRSKIIKLTSKEPPGSILLSSWLLREGYGLSLQRKYKASGWLKSIGNGAMVRTGSPPHILNAVCALQQQAKMSVHPAGKSALSLLGLSHDLALSEKTLMLFSDEKERLPKWFIDYNWGLEIQHHSTNFLKTDIGLSTFSFQGKDIKVSGPLRAVMECIYLAKNDDDLVTCYQLLEGLNAERPKNVQSLLEYCQSVKVLRLFLYMAQKAGHKWFTYLKIDKNHIRLGRGSRSVQEAKGGIYIPEFQIIVPRKLYDL